MGSVVFIPGLGCTAALYDAQLGVLGTAHAVCVADHGNGETLAEIARHILDAAPDRFSIVGLSMGGMLGFEILRQAPRRVERIALLNTTARAELPERKAMRAEIMTLAQDEGMDAVYEATYPFWVDQSRIDDVALRARVRGMLNDTGVERFTRQCRALIDRPDSRTDLAGFDLPALVLVGDGDRTTPPKLAEEMHGLLPQSELVVVPDCGHISTLEQPDAVTPMLQKFLSA